MSDDIQKIDDNHGQIAQNVHGNQIYIKNVTFQQASKIIKRKVFIFVLGRTIELNDDAIVMDNFNPDFPITEGTVNHLGCKIDIDKIDIDKIKTEKLKMDLTIKLSNLIKNDMGSSILGYIQQ